MTSLRHPSQLPPPLPQPQAPGCLSQSPDVTVSALVAPPSSPAGTDGAKRKTTQDASQAEAVEDSDADHEAQGPIRVPGRRQYTQSAAPTGKHCPRFPDRPRKDPMKEFVMLTCHKPRLAKPGFPESVVQTLMKRMNHYVVEKIANIDKMARRLSQNSWNINSCSHNHFTQVAARLRNQLARPSKRTSCQLQKGRRPEPQMKRHLVKALGAAISKHDPSPGMKALKHIERMIDMKYSKSFANVTSAGDMIGNGTASLSQQLAVFLENKRHPNRNAEDSR
ncbi:hypothetical protein MTO96_033266 [Rhipicephalus appendiculatus]